MTDPAAITPALTPDEWKEQEATRGKHNRITAQRYDDRGGLSYSMGLTISLSGAAGPGFSASSFVIPEHAMHVIAALCLHGQRFGFSWEQVRQIESAASAMENADVWAHPDAPGQSPLRTIASTIAALLPPEDK